MRTHRNVSDKEMSNKTWKILEEIIVIWKLYDTMIKHCETHSQI